MTIRSEKSADFSAFTGTLPYELPTYDFIFVGKPFRMGMDLIIFFMDFFLSHSSLHQIQPNSRLWSTTTDCTFFYSLNQPNHRHLLSYTTN